MSTSDSAPLANSTADADAARPAGDLPWPDVLWRLTLVLTPLLALAIFTAHCWIQTVDDQMFGYVGWRLAQGGVPYVDIWQNKPPGVYWLNALAWWLTGSYWGVMTLCAAALVIMHVVFFAVANALYGRASATLATMLAGFYFTQAFYEAGTNRGETFLVVCELVAVWWYLHAFARPAAWKWLVVGVSCGAAFAFKQVGLAACGAMGLHLLWLMLRGRLTWRVGLARGLLLTGGVALMLAVVASGLWLWGGNAGVAAAWHAIFGFNEAYFASGDSQLGYSPFSIGATSDNMFPILTLPVLMACAAVLHGVMREFGRQAEHDASPLVLLTLWLLIALYGAQVCPTKHPWFITPALPPLLLLAADLLHRIRAELGLLRRMQQNAAVCAIVVLMAYFAWPAVEVQWDEGWRVWLERVDSDEPMRWEVVGDVLADLTEPDESIQCWGWMPGVYLHAQRPNACRFATTEKIGQVGAARALIILEEIAESLRNREPKALAITHSDYEWSHGRNGDPPPILHGPLIDANYERVEEIVAFNTYIYLRKVDAP